METSGHLIYWCKQRESHWTTITQSTSIVLIMTAYNFTPANTITKGAKEKKEARRSGVNSSRKNSRVVFKPMSEANK